VLYRHITTARLEEHDEARTMPDIFQSIDDLDAASLQRVIDRLEFRGTYAPFVAMREAYLDRLDLPPGATVCELGCGTGVVSRAIASRRGFDGTVQGTDLSEALVAEARERARTEGIENVVFRAEPSGLSGKADNSCDLVVIHTLISHVADPAAVLAEAMRIASPSARIVIFDGDYASLTCHAGRPAKDAEVVETLLEAIVANPHIMREIPGMLVDRGISLEWAHADVLMEAGHADFFASLVESYIPMAVRAGLLETSGAEDWLHQQRAASESGRFYGSCNFVSYIARA